MRRASLLLSVACLVPAMAGRAAAEPAAVSDAAAVTGLLRQADFWLQQNRPQMAAGAVERVLAVQPGNRTALGLGVRAEAAMGHRETAARYLSQLRAVAPASPEQEAAAAAVRTATIDPAALAEARQLAREGHAGEAAAKYRALFGGPPPDAYALEYYQTLAGAPTGYEEGRQGLARITAQDPSDHKRQLAYAQALTYHPETRRDGIARLRVLASAADTGDEATRAWRQALMWQGNGAQAQSDLQAYLQRFPADAAVAQRLAELQATPPPAPAPPDPVAQARIAAYADLEAGRLQAAASGFRQALARKPDDAESVGGLGLVELREGHNAEARELLERAIALAPERRDQWQRALAGATPQPTARVVADNPAARGEQLRRQAASSADPVATLRQALAVNPRDPWIRLDLARALTRQGQPEEGRTIVDGLVGSAPSVDAIYAAALLAEEQGRTADARTLVQRIDPAARTAPMSALLVRTRVAADISDAAALARAGQRDEARQRLLALAAAPDPTRMAVPAVVSALTALGDPASIAQAAALSHRAGAAGTPAERVALAGALFAAGQDEQATALLRGIDADAPGAALTPAQRHDLAALEAGIAVRAADRLNVAGDRAAAYTQLQPVLARDPDNQAAQLALARLYSGDNRSAEARRIADAALARDPTSFEALASALDAAIGTRDRARAEQLVNDGYVLHPQEARMLLLEARVARAWGNEGRAMALLREAAARRREELARDGSDVGGVPATVAQASPPAFAAANPFQTPRPTIQNPSADVAQDDVSGQIARELASLQSGNAPQFTGSVAVRSRSGTAGIDRLTDVSTPVQASFAPGSLPGKLAIGVTPVYADSGSTTADSGTLRRFGTNVLAGNSTGAAPAGTARGVALSAGYGWQDFSVDVASTPLGFRTTNVGGGISYAPALSDNLRLRITGERRSVTDSILSWGGERDPRTGRIWGGVMRTGAHGQLEYTTGPMTVYAGGGFSFLNGQSVASNTRAEAGAGISYNIIKREDSTLTTGADLVYLSYQKNLSNFTFGQGGYFSPQSYEGVSIPVDYRAKLGDFSYHVGATLGYANWHANSSAVFPTDSALQSALGGAAASNPTLATFYPGESRSGLTGGLRADVDYALSPTLHIGANASYDRTADWNEARGLVYIKKILQP